MGLTRRAVLGGVLGSAATRALAGAPATSLRPHARGQAYAKPSVSEADELVRRTGLGGATAFALADARTGEILESRNPTLKQPPASTAKSLTTLYALDALGADYRFRTRLIATGPIVNGRVEGDLILAGGGDPVLDTDALGEMASKLKDTGLREVAGMFRVYHGALPEIRQIDPEQPPHVSYNPAVGGLNLNFNRVHFGWEKGADGYTVSMDARSRGYRPDVSVAQMEVIDRSTPIYTYADKGGRDEWTVARHALGQSGARWLPVRRPALYCGEVFRTLARAEGIALGGPLSNIEVADSAEGTVLVEHQSAPLADIAREMLKYSTNPTAEILGLSASAARGSRPESLRESAERMDAWLAERFGAQGVSLKDHSGLGDDSRIAPHEMVRILSKAGSDSTLRSLMKPYPIADRPNMDVSAKTGTLNFVSALVGYVTAPDGRELVFAIYCADVERHNALPMELRESPPGGHRWANAARGLQRALLARWGVVYGM